MKPYLAAVAIAAGAVVVCPAQAGRSCEQKRASAESLMRGLRFAEQTRTALEQSSADVVLLARAGQDLRNYGLQYSHFGFAYRDSMPDGARVWRVLHKLNECGTADSAVYRQGLGEFFLDDPWRYEAAWIEPRRDIQEKLLPFLRDSQQVVALNHKPYSMVSYAWGSRYQQSNQWALETFAAAMQANPHTTRPKVQDWLAQNGYVPSTLTVRPLTRLGGRMTKVNIAFDDHPPEKRFSDRIETVTVDSVFDWLQRSGLGGSPVILRLD